MHVSSEVRHPSAPGGGCLEVLKSFLNTRRQSLTIAAPLSAEDQTAQSMPDASPTKWHLAHTSWFFETFVLVPGGSYRLFDDAFGYLFNSYYDAIGDRHPRAERGLLTRPSLDRVLAYRAQVDAAMEALFETTPAGRLAELAPLIRLGVHHEQQHQELMLTDILNLFAMNPLHPAYRAASASGERSAGTPPLRWCHVPEGIYAVGHDQHGFAFDNEGPRHRVLLRPFRIASRCVTNGEWKAFIADDGYRRPELWLSDGFARASTERWRAPLYWRDDGGDDWLAVGLHGLQSIDDGAPVCHVSYYEADAYARWSRKRLPSEFEWEIVARDRPVVGNLLGSGHLAPQPASDAVNDGDQPVCQQLFGDVWEWTSSAYGPYPGFRAVSGAVGEYNGKFMCNQMVLRGGSCVTPDDHIRATYRNFFYPHQRWQFTGVRLAEDV